VSARAGCRSGVASRAGLVLALLGFVACTVPALGAQGTAPMAARRDVPPRSVSGRIVRPSPEGDQGVAGVMVTLHRVGPESAGPIDSLRTSASGAYAFRYQPTGSDDALYFVSASFGGIAYFGSPLRAAVVRGDDGIISVFDTTSKRVPLRINGRHLIVSSSDASQRREVVEVFEVSNDSSVTRVAGGSDSATFRVALPKGAEGFGAGQGDVPGEAMAMVRGRVEVYAPFAPGIKQLSFRYLLPRDAFPLSVPLDSTTELMEVLLEDSTGTVEGARLVRQGPVESSGRTFVRWFADTLPPNAVVRVSFPAGPAGRPRVPQFAVVAAALAALMLFALRFVARRRAPAPAAGEVEPERLAQRIASLDATFERRRSPTDEERATYQAERERLKRELTDALAQRDERG
jgi:hypothetical protein